MGYDDAQYHSDIAVNIGPTSTGTFGAIASAGTGTVSGLGSAVAKAYQAMSLKNVTLAVVTAPGTSIQPCTVAIMDGTTTLATTVVTTLTAGEAATGTVVSAAVASGDTITANAYGTATTSVAAGQNSGAYQVLLNFNKQFS